MQPRFATDRSPDNDPVPTAALASEHAWPPALQAALSIVRFSHEPLALWWGRELLHFQSDAAAELLEDEDSRQVGRPLLSAYPSFAAALTPVSDHVFIEGRRIQVALAPHIMGDLTPVFDGKDIGGILARLEPISATTYANLESVQNETEFQRLADEIPHSIWTHDADGHITWGNHHFYRTTKFSRQGRIARDVWSTIFHPEHLENDVITIDAAQDLQAPHEAMYRLRSTLAAEDEHRWHSIRTVPLTSGDGKVDQWLCISTDVHERYTADDIRAEDLRKFSEAVSQIIWQATPEGDVDYVNTSFYDYTGLDPERVLGQAWYSILHPDDVDHTIKTWHQAVASGESFELEHRFRRADGIYRWFSSRGTALRDADGTIIRWLATSMHIDGRKRNEQIKLFLAEALSTLASSSNIIETCQGIAQHASATIAEFCLLDLRSSDGALERTAWSHRNPERQSAMSTCTNCPPFCGQELEARFSSVLGTRRAHLIRDWKTESHKNGHDPLAVQDPGVARWLHISSMVSVPLLGRAEIVGIITFARTCEGDFFEESDVTALEDVGRCVGLALEAAELAERNRLVADRFQHAALPKNLPSVPGFTFSAVYQAAKSEAYVGGDWYDAFRLADGQIVLSIGDVIGNGLDAAVTMGAVRQAIRGAAQIYSDPVTVLNAADRALRSDQPNRIVTAFVAVLDPMTLTLRYASAGHPPPMLRRLSGGITPLSASDLPLGLRDHRIDEPALSMTITEPSVLVLYTDGLTEATHNIIEGEDRLRAAMEGSEIFATLDPAATIHDAILNSTAIAESQSLACYAQDDVAVLVVRIDDVSRMLTQIHSGEPLRANWQLDVADHAAAKNVRLEIAHALRGRGAAEKDICNAELLFSELIGNVIRHAGGTAEIAIDLSSEYPILHVLDRGPGFTFYARLPNDVMSESGRGLFITAMLTRELSVVRRHDGGSHARAVLNCETTGARSPWS